MKNRIKLLSKEEADTLAAELVINDDGECTQLVPIDGGGILVAGTNMPVAQDKMNVLVKGLEDGHFAPIM